MTRYAQVAEAAADPATFSSEGGGGREGGGTLIEDLPAGFAAGVLLNMMDDPRHHAIRRLVTPGLSPRALARLEPELRRRAARIVDDAQAAGSGDFVTDVAAELPLQAVAALLGIDQDDRHELFEWATATLDYDDRQLGEQSDRTRAASPRPRRVRRATRGRPARPRRGRPAERRGARPARGRRPARRRRLARGQDQRPRAGHVLQPAHRGGQRDDPQLDHHRAAGAARAARRARTAAGGPDAARDRGRRDAPLRLDHRLQPPDRDAATASSAAGRSAPATR